MSTEEELAVTYDMPVEFYRLWLDERLNYSCALYENTDHLEAAQVNKLRWHHDAAKVSADKAVLDIGCGWGANIEYLSRDRGVKNVTGITLSRAQFEYLDSHRGPGVNVEFISYRDYQPAAPFDAIISIGMFEHLATPQQARAGEHIAIYRDYFRRAWEWTTPGSWFALQSVIGLKIPRDAELLRRLAWTTYTIFPGAISPRLEAIAAAVNPHWEIMELKTRRAHYEKTAAEWLRRLRANEELIVQRWGRQRFNEYDRYLDTCVASFAAGAQSLLQAALRRID